VTILGGSRVEEIEIAPEVVDPEDIEMLQDLIMVAVNEAMDTAQADASEKMSAITGGMNIPGLF
jgi:DNA-binding protein YbaB